MFKNECRVCGSSSIEILIDFGEKPIVHNLKKKILDQSKNYNFELAVCKNCNFLFILNPIPPEILYENYFTISEWKFQPHTQRLTDLMMHISGMDENSKILEIGSNDGKFLLELITLGVKNVKGIEPATDAYNISIGKNLNVEKGFFPTKSIHEKEYDIIVFRQVLEHIIKLDEFLLGVHESLKDNGTVVIEVPDTSLNLEQLDYGLWEEHVNYFTLNTLKNLLGRHNFEIIHHERTLFSGVALTVFAKKARKKIIVTPSEYEKTLISYYKDKFFTLKSLLHDFLNNQENVIVYGCGARSSNFINFFELDMISCFIDDQIDKQNLFVPGCNIEILPWSKEFLQSTFLLGVNAENENKVLANRGLLREKCFSISPPSKYIPSFWQDLINKQL